MTQGSPANRPRSDLQSTPPVYDARWVGRASWRQRVGVLRERAAANSIMWWALLVVEGLVIGLGLVLLGVIWLLVVGVAADLEWLSRLGIALIVAGMIVFLRYLAAPITARWIVNVPLGWYYVVEDGNTTHEYLEPGRMIVPWRWNARVRPYVDFNTLHLTVRVENVMDSADLPIDLDIALALSFNPTYADESLYETLRGFTHEDQFEALIADTVRDTVYEHLSRLRLIAGDPVPLDVRSLETVIVEGLGEFEAYGIVPAAERPVTVTVIAPPAVREAYQAIWTQSVQGRSETEILRQIEHVAGDLEVPFDEALQLYFLLQRGLPPPRSMRETQAAAPVEADDTDEVPVEPAPEEPSAEKWVPPRAVDDPNYAPDPFALRRERKRARESRSSRRSHRA